MTIQPSMAVPGAARRFATSGVAALVSVTVVGLLLAGCSATATVENQAGANPGSASLATGSSVAAAAGTTVPITHPPVASAGCKTGTSDKVDNEKRTMNVADLDRFYMFSSPSSDSTKPLPLVVDFHGLLEGAEIQSTLTGLGAKGQEDGFVTATPNGSGTPLRWNTNVDVNKNPDLQFIDAMLEKIETESCIDKSRVYATGLSFGAIMTSFLACNRSDVFAAFAPVSGITLGGTCDQEHKTPILAFHGTADPILYFNGGVSPAILAVMGAKSRTDAAAQGSTTTTAAPDNNGAGYPATVAKWAAMNGCDATPTDTDVSDKVIHRVYSCPAGDDVEFFIIKGGGHNWPGSSVGLGSARLNALGEVNQDIKANDEIWKFFQSHQLPAP
jgi:polyhydroxybutyrate depolymerase